MGISCNASHRRGTVAALGRDATGAMYAPTRDAFSTRCHLRPHDVPMPPMQTTQHTNADAPTTMAPATQERRTRHRLRELCDEVIASYRAAKGHQLFSDRDRADAYALLGQLAPARARR